MLIVNHPLPQKHLKVANSKKSFKKNQTETQFGDIDIDDASATDSVEDINYATSINPFLVLQEVDRYKYDKDKLQQAGNDMLSSLNEIRFGLISGELNQAHIKKLKDVLSRNKHEFTFPELQSIIDDIILRCEVELAKIEYLSLSSS